MAQRCLWKGPLQSHPPFQACFQKPKLTYHCTICARCRYHHSSLFIHLYTYNRSDPIDQTARLMESTDTSRSRRRQAYGQEVRYKMTRLTITTQKEQSFRRLSFFYLTVLVEMGKLYSNLLYIMDNDVWGVLASR